MPTDRRWFQYARALTHSSGNMWPRSYEGQIAELAPLLRFMERTAASPIDISEDEINALRDLPRESARHRVLKHIISQRLSRAVVGLRVIQEHETEFGRVDVAVPDLQIACECGDVSAGRVVNILLGGWSVIIAPFPRGDVPQWRRVKAYTISADADGLAGELASIRAKRDEAMRRCAASLDLGTF